MADGDQLELLRQIRRAVELGYRVHTCRIFWNKKTGRKDVANPPPKDWQELPQETDEQFIARIKMKCNAYLIHCPSSDVTLHDGDKDEEIERIRDVLGIEPHVTSGQGGKHTYSRGVVHSNSDLKTMKTAFGPGSYFNDAVGRKRRYVGELPVISTLPRTPTPEHVTDREPVKSNPNPETKKSYDDPFASRKSRSSANAEYKKLCSEFSEMMRAGKWDRYTVMGHAEHLVHLLGAEKALEKWDLLYRRNGIQQNEQDREHIHSAIEKFGDQQDVIVDDVTETDGGEKRLEPTRRVRLTPASSIKPRPVRWLWDQRVPAGELTLTPGRGGIGKSTCHAWLIAHLTKGTLPGAHYGRTKSCIIAATEDSWDRTIVPRLIVAGADLELVFRVDVVTETDDTMLISLPRDVDGLAEEITRLDVVLMSVDPLLGVVSGGLDTHKDADVRQALQPLVKLADQTGCAVLGNAHFNKSTGSDPLALVMGSAAFGNVARAALGFARDTDVEDGSCVISQVKNNLGRLDLPSLRYAIEEATLDTDEGPASVGRFVMLGESERSVADILNDRGEGQDSTERDEAAEWLTGYIADQGGTARAADVFKAAKADGIAERTLKRARKRAGVTSERSGFGQGSVWTLSPFGPRLGRSGQQSEAGPNDPNGGPNGTPGDDTLADLYDEGGAA